MSWLDTYLSTDSRWNDARIEDFVGGFPDVNFVGVGALDATTLATESDLVLASEDVDAEPLDVTRPDDVRADDGADERWLDALDRADFEPTDEFAPIDDDDVIGLGSVGVSIDPAAPFGDVSELVSGEAFGDVDGAGSSVVVSGLVDPFEAVLDADGSGLDPIGADTPTSPSASGPSPAASSESASDDIAPSLTDTPTPTATPSAEAAEPPTIDPTPDVVDLAPSAGSARLDAFELLDIDPVGDAVTSPSEPDLPDDERTGGWDDSVEGEPGFDA
ncbi:MAG: hypothetical protein AAFP84_10235 [Actinomycetota bacterium]